MSLEMQEKTMGDDIATIQSGGDDKKQLIKFKANLNMWENILTDAIAKMNARGDIFNPTTMLEALKKEVA